jgi:hypothetical protein
LRIYIHSLTNSFFSAKRFKCGPNLGISEGARTSASVRLKISSREYPKAYGVEKEKPDESTIKAVLGKKLHDASQYSDEEQQLFGTYHSSFKLGSKPAAHIEALAKLSDADLLANMPESLGRLAEAVIAKLAELPE